MNHLAARIVFTGITFLGAVITGARLLGEAIGLSTAPGDLPVAEGLLRQAIGFVLAMPWWAPLLVTIALSMITAYVYKVTYSREVIIKSDNIIVDLRSSAETVIDFAKGQNFLIKPTQNIILYPGENPREGIYKIYILFHAERLTISFSNDFEFANKGEHKIAETNTFYEISIAAIKDGRRFRYLVSDVQHDISVMRSQAIMYATAFGR